MAEKKTSMKTVWFHLRSGRVIRVRLRDLDMETADGRITSYTWSGMPARTGHFWRRRLLFLDPTEIAAVEIRGG